MKCLNCGGPLEYAGNNAAYARCTHCLALFENHNPNLVPIQVQAPGGGNNPQFNAVFAQQLGFAPRQASHETFNLGGGVGVKVNTAAIERKAKAKISGCIWGIIFSVVFFIIFAAVVGWILWQVKKASDEVKTGSVPTKEVKAATWDGKSPFTCGGVENVKIEKVDANITSGTAINVMGMCQLTLVNVNVTAPVALEVGGNAKVTMTGGSLKGKTKAISAGGNATVTLSGTKVDGKTEQNGNGKISGLPAK
jgi:hypothetical protein